MNERTAEERRHLGEGVACEEEEIREEERTLRDRRPEEKRQVESQRSHVAERRSLLGGVEALEVAREEDVGEEGPLLEDFCGGWKREMEEKRETADLDLSLQFQNVTRRKKKKKIGHLDQGQTGPHVNIIYNEKEEKKERLISPRPHTLSGRKGATDHVHKVNQKEEELATNSSYRGELLPSDRGAQSMDEKGPAGPREWDITKNMKELVISPRPHSHSGHASAVTGQVDKANQKEEVGRTATNSSDRRGHLPSDKGSKAKKETAEKVSIRHSKYRRSSPSTAKPPPLKMSKKVASIYKMFAIDPHSARGSKKVASKAPDDAEEPPAPASLPNSPQSDATGHNHGPDHGIQNNQMGEELGATAIKSRDCGGHKTAEKVSARSSKDVCTGSKAKNPPHVSKVTSPVPLHKSHSSMVPVVGNGGTLRRKVPGEILRFKHTVDEVVPYECFCPNACSTPDNPRNKPPLLHWSGVPHDENDPYKIPDGPPTTRQSAEQKKAQEFKLTGAKNHVDSPKKIKRFDGPVRGGKNCPAEFYGVYREKCCPLKGCKIRLADADLLRLHLLFHCGPWLCTVCGRHFKCSSDLQRHHNLHVDCYMYLCHRCSYKSAKSADISDHVQTHMVGPRAFECHLCFDKLKTKKILKQHLANKHYGYRKFSCSKCDYSSHQRADVQNHYEARHLKAIIYKCVSTQCRKVRENGSCTFNSHHRKSYLRHQKQFWH